MAYASISHASIYGIKNLITGKIYIGSTGRNVKLRFIEHRRSLRRGTHYSVKLHRAWKQYGESAFEFFVLETVERDREVVLAREQYWLNNFRSATHGYNILPTAGSPLGHEHSPEHNRRIAEALTGKPFTQERCINISEGRKKSERAKRAITAHNATKRALTDDQVRLVIALRKDDMPMHQIASEVGVSRRVVRAILSGETYNDITGLPRAA